MALPQEKSEVVVVVFEDEATVQSLIEELEALEISRDAKVQVQRVSNGVGKWTSKLIATRDTTILPDILQDKEFQKFMEGEVE